MLDSPKLNTNPLEKSKGFFYCLKRQRIVIFQNRNCLKHKEKFAKKQK